MVGRLVDLTMPIHEGMPFNPDHFPPHITPYAQVATHGWSASRLVLDSHLGTHLDAPCHFVDGAPCLDDIALEHLVGPTQVIHLDSVRDDEAIGPERLPIIKDPRVLMSTGWWRHADDPDRYFARYPYLTLDAAAVLINSGVRLVGIDGPSVDRDGETHKEFLSRGVVIVENLISLDKLPETCTVWILPLRIAGGDGSPVRAVAEVALPG
jgi:arylformamidase